jgi:hypothetical protein
MTSTLQRVASAALIACAALATPAGVDAQTTEVDALLRRGLSMRRDGHDAEAYQAFEAAWNVSRSPRARAQMGLAAQALGRWADADRFVREALAVSGDGWVSERRAVLERSLSDIDAHLGRLELRCNVDGAEVRVDGAPRGTTPLPEPLRLPAGTVTLQIGAPGYLEVTRQAVLAIGQATREQIDLVAVPRVTSPPPPEPSVVAPPPPRRDGPIVMPRTPPPEGPPPRGALQRTLAWTAGGVAVAGVALGAVFLALRNDEATSFNARNADGASANDCPRGSSAQACLDAEAAVATRGAIATTGFVIGGAAAIASALLFATLPSRGAQARVGVRGCAAAVGRDGLAVACEVTF